MSEKRNVKKLRYDILLIAVLLVISAVWVMITVFSRTEGGKVEVEIEGALVASYSLEENGEYPLNGGTNILVIEDGAAYLTYANCPDKVCVNRGKIRDNGQSIICLPNKLTVTVRAKDGGADIVQ